MTTALTLMLGSGAPALAGPADPPANGAPDAVVERVTARHVEILSGLIEKVPARAQERIQKAIEVSLRGGERALEALQRAGLSGSESGSPESASQVRGLERAIQAIEEATDRSTAQLEVVLGRVPEEAAEAIASAINHIESGHAAALERLEGLLESGVSALHPPARPEPGARPAVARPERPETPAAGTRPELIRPARPVAPVVPERPVRP